MESRFPYMGQDTPPYEKINNKKAKIKKLKIFFFLKIEIFRNQYLFQKLLIFSKITLKIIFCFASNFFKTSYFFIISFLVKRSRAVDAKNDQTLGLTPSEHRDICTQSPWGIYAPRKAKG